MYPMHSCGEFVQSLSKFNFGLCKYVIKQENALICPIWMELEVKKRIKNCSHAAYIIN